MNTTDNDLRTGAEAVTWNLADLYPEPAGERIDLEHADAVAHDLAPGTPIVTAQCHRPLAIVRRFLDSLRRKPWGGPERT